MRNDGQLYDGIHEVAAHAVAHRIWLAGGISGSIVQQTVDRAMWKVVQIDEVVNRTMLVIIAVAIELLLVEVYRAPHVPINS